MFDIVVNCLLNDLSNVYHSYFMKFYLLFNICGLLTSDLQNITHNNIIRNVHCPNDHIFLNIINIVVNYLLNDLSNVYHSYFMKFYLLYNIYGLLTSDLQNIIHNI